jgi:hypothetical protein
MSKQKNAIAVRTIGIDTGKNTLHMVGLDERGEVVLREKVSRPVHFLDCVYRSTNNTGNR